VDDGGVRRVAAGTGLRLHPVDTLVGQPPTAPATGAQNTYVNRMEQILSVLSGALRCDSGNQ
jgi:hypothetical protein